MRVGVNVALLSSSLTGVGYYVLSLVRALPRVDPSIEWVFLGGGPELRDIAGSNAEIVAAEVRSGFRRTVWEQCVLPRLALQTRLDILHCPNYSRPVWCEIPIINTIHDLSCYAPQPFFSAARVAYARSMTRVAVRKSIRIMANSEFTRQEILRRFPIDPGRVAVVHHAHAIDPGLNDRQPDRQSPFLLFVGTLEERKNIVTLIRAFSRLCSGPEIKHRLVLAGGPGFGWPKIQQAIRASPFRERIVVVGYVSREDILELYRSADVFVHPSLYEGFGVPLLEAMACGAPVVCSDIEPFREVAGDAAVFFDTRSAESLANAVRRVLESSCLQAAMQQKGLDRARQFSWDQCARGHCDVYRGVLSMRMPKRPNSVG